MILDATSNLKHKAFLALMYGSGLRVSEVAKLRISDICSRTMRVRIVDAKHGTDRYTILSDTALEILRKYFKVYFSLISYKSDDWLFPGRDHGKHISIKTIKNTIIKIRDRLCLDNKISSHTLRHCFATHSLENGVDPVFIQQMLGHKRLQSTLTYLHMTSKSLMGVKSPLDICDAGSEANRNKKKKLELCRKLTRSPSYKPRFEGLKTIDILCILVCRDVTICPSCSKGKLQIKQSFLPGSSP